MAKENYCRESCKFFVSKDPETREINCEIGHKQNPKTKEASIHLLLNNGSLCPMNPWKSAAYQAKAEQR